MKARFKYREQKYFYGEYMEVNMFPVYDFVRSCSKRVKRKPTSKIQERLNQINAERKLARMIPANFTNNDMKFELTYAPQYIPESIEQAQKDMINFLRRIKRARKKANLPEMKYIYSLEQGSKKKRIHFHVIMTGGLSIKEIQTIWGLGYVDKILPLMFDEKGCTGIAKYFCKQKISGKRWVSSRNCIKPEPKNNDSKLTKRIVKEFAVDCENHKLFETLYPEYYYAECKPFWNEDNGAYYLTLYMYKRTAKLDIELQCRRKQ